MSKKRKIRIGVIFGGRSAEHEVSLQSAKNVIAALDAKKYEAVLVAIDKEGKWCRCAGKNYLLHDENPNLIVLNKEASHRVALIPSERKPLTEIGNKECSERSRFYGVRGAAPQSVSLDVVFPVLHGPLGEDGTVQGLLKLMNIPFVGSSVLGSAIGMDKDVQKRLLRDAGIPIARFLTYGLGGGNKKNATSFAEAKKKLGFPMFVKPANASSSVGISKARTARGFNKAVELAFRYDSKILLEEGIDGREIECAVLGNENPIASVVGEVRLAHEFYFG